MSNNVWSKLIYKGIPFILTLISFIVFYLKVLTSDMKEEVKSFFSALSQYRELYWDIMDLFMYLIIYACVIVVLGLIFWGTYSLIKFLWSLICITFNIIKVTEDLHILTLVNKKSEERTVTTYTQVGSVSTPITSHYTDYYAKFKIGNSAKESILYEMGVTESLYDSLVKGEKYKGEVTTESILGITVNLYISQSSIKKA